MSDLRTSLSALVQRIGNLRAALVFETSGIEVAATGQIDFEVVTAELAEVWLRLAATELVSAAVPAGPQWLEARVAGESWLLLPLGGDYLLALLVDPHGLPGRARFYASEWAHEHREEFA